MVSKPVAAALIALAALGAALSFYHHRERSLTAVDLKSAVRIVSITPRLSLRLQLAAGCEVGDLDVIRARHAGPAQASLLLTLESLEAKSMLKPLVRRLKLADLQHGATIPFTLDGFDGSRDNVGVFLCSDRQQTGSCLGKSLLDMQDESSKVFAKRKRNGTVTKREGRDVVYVFQYLRIDNGRLLTMRDAPGPGQLAALGQLGLSDKTQALAQAALTSTSSPPLAFYQEGDLTVQTLPLKVFDRAACEKETLAIHRQKVEQEKRLGRHTRPAASQRRQRP